MLETIKESEFVHAVNKNLLYSLVITLFFSFHFGFGQGICKDTRYVMGGFSLSSTDICHNEAIAINNIGNVEEAKYYFNYQSESYETTKALGSDKLDFSNLKKSEVFTVIQVGKKEGKESVFCLENVKVRVNNSPVYSYSYCLPNLTVSIPEHLINDYDAYEIVLNGKSEMINKEDLPYKKEFKVANSNELLVKGIGNSKTCEGSPVPLRISYNPTKSNDIDVFPVISKIQITENSQVKLDIQGQFNEDFRLYRFLSTSGYLSGKTIAFNVKAPQYVDNSLGEDVLKNSYCYIIEPTSKCSITNTHPAICTIAIKKEATTPTQNIISWHKFKIPYVPLIKSDMERFEIQKSGVGEIIKSTEIKNADIVTTYKDDGVDCKYRHCYRVKVTTAGTALNIIGMGGIAYNGESYSNEVCIDYRLDLNEFPDDALVSTEDQKNLIKFDDTSSSPYGVEAWLLFKKEGEKFEEYKKLTASPFQITDEKTPTQSEKYQLKYVDKCNNSSAFTPSFSSIYLKENKGSFLEWTADNPFADQEIDRYVIYYFRNKSDKEAIFSVVQNSTQNHHKIDYKRFSSEGTFVVKAVSKSGIEALSNRITFVLNGYIFMPNIFTPNGDTKNDEFAVRGAIDRINQIYFSIYNRKGKQIAEYSSALQGWDGNLPDGSPAVEDVYFYVLKAEMSTGEKVNRNGSFVLRR